MNAAQEQTRRPIASIGEAEQSIASLATIMEHLGETIAEETERVRAGHLPLAEAEAAKAELARAYAAETARLSAAKDLLSRAMPEAVAALRQRHAAFQCCCR